MAKNFQGQTGGHPFNLDDLHFIEKGQNEDTLRGLSYLVGGDDNNSAIILSGGTISGGFQKTIQAGYLYWNGALYSFPKTTYSESGALKAYWAIQNTVDPQGVKTYQDNSSVSTYLISEAAVQIFPSSSAPSGVPQVGKTKSWKTRVKEILDLDELEVTVGDIETYINTTLLTLIGDNTTAISNNSSSITNINTTIGEIEGAWTEISVSDAKAIQRTGAGTSFTGNQFKLKYKTITNDGRTAFCKFGGTALIGSGVDGVKRLRFSDINLPVDFNGFPYQGGSCIVNTTQTGSIPWNEGSSYNFDNDTREYAANCFYKLVNNGNGTIDIVIYGAGAIGSSTRYPDVQQASDRYNDGGSAQSVFQTEGAVQIEPMYEYDSAGSGIFTFSASREAPNILPNLGGGGNKRVYVYMDFHVEIDPSIGDDRPADLDRPPTLPT